MSFAFYMVAGSKESFIVLQNEGESRLEVKVYTPASVEKHTVTVNKTQTVRVCIHINSGVISLLLFPVFFVLIILILNYKS